MTSNTIVVNKSEKVVSVRKITMTALLAAIAYILAFLEFPVPLSPSFARMDLSDLPALIGAFAFGPITGVMIELIKNALQLLSTSTGGIGELANFLMGTSYVLTAGFTLGAAKVKQEGYFVTDRCIGCKLCYSKCPQKCIDISKKPVAIHQENCLHCGNCYEICPARAIEKLG